MTNPYLSYYNNQVGSGLAGFQGVRFQRGHGFFGRIFSGIGNFVKQLAPSLIKRTLPSAIGLAQDVMEGENFGQSTKKRLIEAGKNAADETLEQLKTRIQKGSGIMKRRRPKSRFLNLKKFRKRPYKKRVVKKTKRKIRRNRKK